DPQGQRRAGARRRSRSRLRGAPADGLDAADPGDRRASPRRDGAPPPAGRGLALLAALYTSRCPVSEGNWSTNVIETIDVIGAGRVGSAVSARLRERGLTLAAEGADLVLLCVPD